MLDQGFVARRPDNDPTTDRLHPIIHFAYDLAFCISRAVKEYQTGVINAPRSIANLYKFFDDIKEVLRAEGSSAEVSLNILAVSISSEFSIFLGMLDRRRFEGHTDWEENIVVLWPERKHLADYADAHCLTLLELSEQPWTEIDRARLDRLLEDLMAMSGMLVVDPDRLRQPWKRLPFDP